MKDIGIRELKARVSELVRHVAEEHTTYTITRRGRPVGVLAPSDYVAAQAQVSGSDAWKRMLALADRMAKQTGPRKSALQELVKMRR